MTDRRILDDDASEMEVTLLRAARSYRLPETARHRTLAAVAAMTVGPPVASARPAGWNLKTKLLAGVVSCSIAAGTFTWTTTRDPSPPIAEPLAGTSTPSAIATQPAIEPAPSIAPPPEPSSIPVGALPTVPAAGESVNRAANAGASASTPQADDAEELAAELAALDRAKRALESGDASGAVKLLDAHDARFRGGRLSPEATVLRIEALFASGNSGAAEKLAATFLAHHPRSPLAERVRSLVAARKPMTGAENDK